MAGLSGFYFTSPILWAQSLSADVSITPATDIELLRQDVAAHPEDATRHFLLADRLWEEKNLNGAIEAYWDVIACDPLMASVYINLGQIYKERKQNDLAESAYEAVANLLPDSHIPYFLLGNVAYETRRYRIAIRDLNRSIARVPANQEIPEEISAAYLCMTDCYIHLGNTHEALATLERFVKHRGLSEIDPWIFDREGTGFAGKLFQLYMRLGQQCLTDKNTPDCATCYKRGLQIQPQIADFYYFFNYGSVLMDSQVDDVQTAVGIFERAIALGSDKTDLMANALRGYAVALDRTANPPQKIIEVFERLVKLQPEDPLLWLNLAKLQIVSGTHTQESIYNNLKRSIDIGGENYRSRMLTDPLLQALVQQYPQFDTLVNGTPTPGLVPLTTAATDAIPATTPLVK